MWYDDDTALDEPGEDDPADGDIVVGCERCQHLVCIDVGSVGVAALGTPCKRTRIAP